MVDRIVEVPQVQDLATLLQIACHAQEILENTVVPMFCDSGLRQQLDWRLCAELFLCLCRS